MIVKLCPVKGQSRPFLPAKGEYEAEVVQVREVDRWSVPGDHCPVARLRLHEVPGSARSDVALRLWCHLGDRRRWHRDGGVAVLNLADSTAARQAAGGQQPGSSASPCRAYLHHEGRGGTRDPGIPAVQSRRRDPAESGHGVRATTGGRSAEASGRGRRHRPGRPPSLATAPTSPHPCATSSVEEAEERAQHFDYKNL